MIETLTREAIREDVAGDGAQGGSGVKGWFSIRVNRPCTSCGAQLEYFTINHIPGCWQIDDANMHEMTKHLGAAEVVEAPENAVPMNVLRQFEKKCRRGG